MEYYLGCSGWNYDEWKGRFYPEDLENKYWLSYYSQIFNFVEIESTFYKIPSKLTAPTWMIETPDDFKFTVKFPKTITHNSHLSDIRQNIQKFYKVVRPLENKILSFLIQLPPWLDVLKGINFLNSLDELLDKSFRYAIEVRHPSWFNDLSYNYFKHHDYCLVWSQHDKLATPPIITSNFVYMRLIGNRSFDDKNFGKIVFDRTVEMEVWSKILLGIQNKVRNVSMAIVSANNYYSGFAPASAKSMAELMKLGHTISFPITNYKL
jgi:uncharacterized protein YecE (DUF72 family)